MCQGGLYTHNYLEKHNKLGNWELLRNPQLALLKTVKQRSNGSPFPSMLPAASTV